MKILKKFLFLCMSMGLFLSASAVFAQNTISGVIIDRSTNSPKSEVLIELKGTKYSCTSSENGSFTMSVPNQGEQILIISAEEYVMIEIDIDIKNGIPTDVGTVTISNDLSTMSLEELMNISVSVSTKSKSTIDESPSIVTVIDRKTIDKSCAQTLADIIRFIPGFDYSKASLGWGEPLDEMYSRGVLSDFTQTILILLNGRNKFNDFTYASPFMSTRINVDMIERIEIIRGPGSALYGGNAFAAVINIITRDVDANQETVFELTGTSTKGGSIYALTKNKILKTDWMLGLQGKYFFDKGTTYGEVQTDKKFTLQKIQDADLITDGIDPSYDLSMNVTSPKEIFRIQAWHTNHNPHPFLSGFFPQPNNGNYKYQGIQTFVNFDLKPIENLSIGGFYSSMDWDCRLTLYWDSLVRVTQPVFGPDDLYGPSQKNTQEQIEANYTIPLENHNILIGAAFMGESQTDPATTYWDGTQERDYTDTAYVSYLTAYRNQFSGYIQDNWSISERLAATIGLRYDFYDDIKDKTILNPRLALVWDPAKNHKFKFLYGEAYRPPSGFETRGVLYPLTGNPDLKPEKIKAREIAYINYTRFTRFQINGFYNSVKNSIGTDLDGNYLNQGKLTSLGIEAELTGKTWWVNYTYISSKTEDSDGNTETTRFIAPHSFNAGISYSIIENLTVRNQICFKGVRKDFVGGETKAQFDDDLSVIYNLKHFDFTLGCRNLFDQKWNMPLKDEIYTLPYRGREIFVKIKVRL